MIRLFEIKLPVNHAPDALKKAAARALRISETSIDTLHIRRQAVDARKKNAISFVYTVDCRVQGEQNLVRKYSTPKIIIAPDETYVAVTPGTTPLCPNPLVVGSGPAGLFTALLLAQNGYHPVLIERGADVDMRAKNIDSFWKKGTLDPESNVQFGEGGAGTFSDGKLTTLINDPRCKKVLEEFVAAGAPEHILFVNKPHIGTDLLRDVVKNIRNRIIALGGKVMFNSKVTDIRTSGSTLCALQINGREWIDCAVAVFAIGHSARDTATMLHVRSMTMTQKPFAIGVRIEHPQILIDKAQYGAFAGHPRLGAADYKMAFHDTNHRSAFTFCMCPGGEVIAAASEPGGIVTNGMSYNARSGRNANAALLVNITPADFPDSHPLSGFTFQRIWEAKAFELAGSNYYAPVQRLDDFLNNRKTVKYGSIAPTYTPGVTSSDLSKCLPSYVIATLHKALPHFNRQISGFAHPDALLTGVETRSSSPLRMTRSESFESNLSGLYVAGEGAGYAGGITSAAADGIRVAEAIIQKFRPL
ncbi:MAG: NAD(P)/FAD-dependent oxidoreductase [Fibrobacterota bacterium]|nr:NAD(P)-binding protein [Chitinispirillaceae bacterium]